MKIVFDVSHIQHRGAGISRYCAQLLSKVALANDSDDLIIHGWSTKIAAESIRDRVSRRAASHILPIPGPIKRTYWNVWRWPPLETFLGKFAIFQSGDWSLPPLREGKGVVIVHDLWQFRSPDDLPSYVVRGMRYFHRSIGNAHGVIVPSRTIGEEVRKVVAPGKPLCVCPPAVDSCFVAHGNVQEDRKVLREFGVEEPYIISVGTLEPRKNLLRLLRAFCRANAQVKSKYRLVLVGKHGWKSHDLDTYLSRKEVKGEVLRLGFVPDDVLAALYRRAKCLVYATLYEGYGFPVAEALMCGTPVITSKGTACAEVADNAAEFVDPSNEDEIAQALLRVMGGGWDSEQSRARILKRAEEIRAGMSGNEVLNFYRSLE